MPQWIQQAAAAHDAHILACLNTLLGPDDLLCLGSAADAELPAEWVAAARLAVQQARLPIREGGLGLVSAADASPAAYVGG